MSSSTNRVPIAAEQMEGALAVAETFDRATITTQEQRFRKILTMVRNGLLTEREAFAEVCEVMDVPMPLNTPWWIYIEREHGPDLAIGPYPDEASAKLATEESLLVEGECQEDCTDCWWSSDQPSEKHEQVIIDLDDPDHTGAYPMKCATCGDAVTRDGDTIVGSDGEITCPDSDRPHGPAVPDDVED